MGFSSGQGACNPNQYSYCNGEIGTTLFCKYPKSIFDSSICKIIKRSIFTFQSCSFESINGFEPIIFFFSNFGNLATREYYALKDCATAILPIVAPLLVDREQEVRDIAFLCLQCYVDHLKKATQSPDFIQTLDEQAQSGQQKESGYFDWAISSVSSLKEKVSNKVFKNLKKFNRKRFMEIQMNRNKRRMQKELEQ